jgi:hypothetical protein
MPLRTALCRYCAEPCPQVTRAPSPGHGQFSTPPCKVQRPRGPTRSGPMLFSRRPSLSQQPAGSHVVMAARGVVSGGGAGAMAGSGGCAGRSVGGTGGTTWAGCGAPDRSRLPLPLSRPRQAATARRRACMSRSSRALRPGSLSTFSSSSRAAMHSLEFSGSAAGSWARSVPVAARASSKAAMWRDMPGWSCAGAIGSLKALSDTPMETTCLT